MIFLFSSSSFLLTGANDDHCYEHLQKATMVATERTYFMGVGAGSELIQSIILSTPPTKIRSVGSTCACHATTIRSHIHIFYRKVQRTPPHNPRVTYFSCLNRTSWRYKKYTRNRLILENEEKIKSTLVINIIVFPVSFLHSISLKINFLISCDKFDKIFNNVMLSKIQYNNGSTNTLWM